MVIRCQITLHVEGHRVRLAEAWVGLSSCYCGSKVHSFGQCAAATCTVLPTASDGQYVTSNCKPLLFVFPC